jgi:hypothetical protein
MKIKTLLEQPEITRTHTYYFRVENYNRDIAQRIGLKQTRDGWVLYRYNTSGRGFDLKYNEAVNSFGRPYKVTRP